MMKKVIGIVVGLILMMGSFLGFQSTASASELSDSENTETQIEDENDNEDGSEIEISPEAIFSPNMCIIANKVVKKGSGWYVNDIFLDKKAKEGFLSSKPEVGDNIAIMTDSANDVVGWQVQ